MLLGEAHNQEGTLFVIGVSAAFILLSGSFFWGLILRYLRKSGRKHLPWDVFIISHCLGILIIGIYPLILVMIVGIEEATLIFKGDVKHWCGVAAGLVLISSFVGVALIVRRKEQ